MPIEPDVVVTLVEVPISIPPAELASEPPVREIEPVPVTEAVMPIRFNRPALESVMLSTEVKFPVGSIVVLPPEIERVVPAVKAPAPA